MIYLLLLLSFYLQSIDSCIPSSPIIPATPIIPCRSCPSFPATAFATDVMSVDANGCAVRTLTCGTAPNSALITYNGATNIPGIGPLTFDVTCNAPNTDWLYMGTPIAIAECFAPCQTCPTFPATAFASDTMSVDASGCAVRTLTCGSAPTSALITYNGATNIPGIGPLTFAATCNAANTDWLYMGTPVSQAVCSEPCQTCPTFPATNFASDTPSVDGNGCQVRTLSCGAATSTNTLITYNGATNIPGTGTLPFVATCNAANTQWTYMGIPITQAACFEPCQTCPTIPATGQPWMSDVLSYDANGCRVRTLVCAPPGATIVTIYYNVLTPIFMNTNTLTISITCNAANTQWNYAPAGTLAITTVQCTSMTCLPPPCPG